MHANDARNATTNETTAAATERAALCKLVAQLYATDVLLWEKHCGETRDSKQRIPE